VLEALGNLGDFVGGLAVIATLLYLAVQVRQNTKLLRASALTAWAEARVALNNMLASDPDLARIMQTGIGDFLSLSEAERRQFINLMRGLFTTYEHQHQLYETGLIDRETWEYHRETIGDGLSRPQVAAWWEHRKYIFSPSFVRAVDAIPRERRTALADQVLAAMETACRASTETERRE